MNITLVPLVHVDQIFPQCEEFFQRSIDRGGGDDLTLGYLYSECRAGRAFLYVNVSDKVTDAMIIRFENPEIARVLVFGGEGGIDWKSEFPEFSRTIRNYAKKLVFSGRKGWERKLPVKVRAVSYEMEIN